MPRSIPLTPMIYSKTAILMAVLLLSAQISGGSDTLKVLDEVGGEIASLRLYRIGGRGYVLSDDLCSAFNAKQRYIPIAHKLQIFIGKHRVDLRIGEASLLVDGRVWRKPLSSPVQLISDRPALPVEFVSTVLPDLLGLKGEFDSKGMVLRLLSSIPIPPPTTSEGKFTVVIDPGHGGSDSGLVMGNLREKDVNLRIAEVIASKLRGKGVEVRLTRDKDIPLSLDRRIRFANSLHCDLYLSIHCDGSAIRQKRGYRILVDRIWRERREGMIVAASPPLSAERLQTAYELATKMASGFEGIGLVGRVYRLPIHRFSELTMPALILEPGFLSNDADRVLLTDEDFLNSIGDVVAEVISEMKGDVAGGGEGQ